MSELFSLQPGQWSPEKAQQWHAQLPYLIGANYIPANAVNQLEMWQAETFDPERIGLELGWAEKIGMNTMRVFLHDLLWEQDKEAFKQRINIFLTLCFKHKIKPMLVLFDSCWDPYPRLGVQRGPTPGVHNSGWVQGPGAHALRDPKQHPRLKGYVQDIVSTFGNDPRVLVWDVWNEPDNMNPGNYGETNLKQEIPDKLEYVLKLLPQVFQWSREANPTQPLTAGLWRGEWGVHENLEPIHKVQVEYSDVISFHNYDSPEIFEGRIHSLQKYNRPMLCTEYMARVFANTFDAIIPLARKYNVGCYNWGFVAGKTQTFIPWDSWQSPYVGGREPQVWFHDIFHMDGTFYRPEESSAFEAMQDSIKFADGPLINQNTEETA